MHGLAVYVKQGLPFARNLSLENSASSYLYFQLALLHSVSYFFFLYQSPSLLLCTVFDSISSNVDEILSIKPFANVFVFGDFNIHHKDWLTYLVELIDHSSLKSFFCLYQRNKSSESKAKFRQASNCCKRVLEAAKLAYATKTTVSLLSVISEVFEKLVNNRIVDHLEKCGLFSKYTRNWWIHSWYA